MHTLTAPSDISPRPARGQPPVPYPGRHVPSLTVLHHRGPHIPEFTNPRLLASGESGSLRNLFLREPLARNRNGGYVKEEAGEVAARWIRRASRRARRRLD